MATVIPEAELSTHNINKYSFKVMALGGAEDEADKSNLIKGEAVTTHNETPVKPPLQEVDSSALSSSSKESLIESLMQKTDEMSSNFIKLQMKLESKEEEFEIALKKAKEEAFAEGIEAGIAQAKETSLNETSKSIELFSASVVKLEESAKEFDTALEGIKRELMSAALDISKEVIKVELQENSNKVAQLLSEELIKELQSASNITLKVNPKNHGFISEHLSTMQHINVVSDSAVSEGGVVVISDVGNIDAEISKRFERVKRAALSE
jgi:flagellar assembly protein FliH